MELRKNKRGITSSDSNTWEQSLIINLTDDGLTMEQAQEYVEFVQVELEKAIQEGYNRGRIKTVEQSELNDIILKAKEHGREEGRQEAEKDNLEFYQIATDKERQKILGIIEETSQKYIDAYHYDTYRQGIYKELREALKNKINDSRNG